MPFSEMENDGARLENGEIAYPVDELTIAGNLKDMFRAIEAVGDEADRRSHITIGPVLLGKMMVAGSSADSVA